MAAPSVQAATTSLIDKLHRTAPCTAAMSAAPIQFYPPMISLDGGTTRQVRIQVAGCLPSGTYKSVLEVDDTTDDTVLDSKELKVTKAEPGILAARSAVILGGLWRRPVSGAQ